MEGAGHTLVAQAPHHVVLEGQSWELQGGPREVGGVGGAPCSFRSNLPTFQTRTQGQGGPGKSTLMRAGHHVNSNSQLMEPIHPVIFLFSLCLLGSSRINFRLEI